MLDSIPVTLGNSQEWTRGLEQEGTVTAGLASQLSLRLDDSQESEGGVGGNRFLETWRCVNRGVYRIGFGGNVILLDFGCPI